MAKEYKKPISLKDITTPFNQGFNSTLVKQAGLTSKYGTMGASGGYEGYGEVDVDKILDPMKKALQDSMSEKEGAEDKDVCECKEKKDGVTKKYTGKRDPETGECLCQGQDSTTDEEEETTKKTPTKEEGCSDEEKAACVEPKILNDNCECVDAEEDGGGKGPGGDKVVGEIKNDDGGNDSGDDTEDTPPTEPCCDGKGKWEKVSPNNYNSAFKTNSGSIIDGWKCVCPEGEANVVKGGENAEEVVDEIKNDDSVSEKNKELKELKDDIDNQQNQFFKKTSVVVSYEDVVDGQLGEGTWKNLNEKQRKELKKQIQKGQNKLYENNQYSNKTANSVFNNHPRAVQLGQGDLKVKKNKIAWNDDGSMRSVKQKGVLSKNGEEYDYEYEFEVIENGYSLKDVDIRRFSPKIKGSGFKDVWKDNGEYNIPEWKALTERYTTLLGEAYSAIREANKLKGKKGRDALLKITHNRKYSNVLMMQAVGLDKILTMPESPLEFKSPLKHPAEDSNLEGYKEGLRHAHNEDGSWKWVADGAPDDAKPHRNTPTSPFSRRDRSHLNVRKKWTPNQSTPMMYGSPFHQEIDPNQDPTIQNPEEMAGIEGQETQQPQGETVWDKMKMYGDSIETQVDKFIGNANYNGEVDKPIKAIQNQEWVGRITEWLKEKKGQLIQAKKSKDKEAEQKINQSVQSLVGDITSYAGKFEEWINRNGGDETPGNKGGNMTSEGSSKDKRFEADLAFIGDPNTSMDITEEGKIGIKSYGLQDLKYVDELDTDVFVKDFRGYQQMLEMSAQLQEDAESGRPLNKNIIGGQADMLLANKDSLLSWAHDPLYGQAWIQDYAQGNPGENLDWAMPESDQFDKDRLEDEVHGWLTDKLTQAYTKYAPKDVKDAESIKEETMASIDQEGYSKDTPMAYKQNQMTAQQLIAKYS